MHFQFSMKRSIPVLLILKTFVTEPIIQYSSNKCLLSIFIIPAYFDRYVVCKIISKKLFGYMKVNSILLMVLGLKHDVTAESSSTTARQIRSTARILQGQINPYPCPKAHPSP